MRNDARSDLKHSWGVCLGVGERLFSETREKEELWVERGRARWGQLRDLLRDSSDSLTHGRVGRKVAAGRCLLVLIKKKWAFESVTPWPHTLTKVCFCQARPSLGRQCSSNWTGWTLVHVLSIPAMWLWICHLSSLYLSFLVWKPELPASRVVWGQDLYFMERV